MLDFKAGIHKMLLRIANREDHNQTASLEQSDLGLHCLSRPFWKATSTQNFRTITVYIHPNKHNVHKTFQNLTSIF